MPKKIDREAKKDKLRCQRRIDWMPKDAKSAEKSALFNNPKSAQVPPVQILAQVAPVQILVFGLVDFGSSPFEPFSRKAANQYLIVRSLNGQTLDICLMLISLSRIGLIHLSRSTAMLFAMVFIPTQLSEKSAICPYTLPPAIDIY